MKIVKPEVVLLAVTPNAETIIYTSLRQCYSELFAKDIFADNVELFMKEINIVEKKKLIQTVFSSGHTSVAEHVNFTFGISGVSRAFSHQAVRTRHSTVSQQSQRYVVMNDDIPIVWPKSCDDASNMEAVHVYDTAMRAATEAYVKLINLGIPAEDARFVLPNATATAYVVTMNCVSLAHTLGLRLCERSQWEYRTVANMMFDICKQLVPTIFELVGPRCEVLGYCPEAKPCGRKITKAELFRRASLYKDTFNKHEDDHEFGDE